MGPSQDHFYLGFILALFNKTLDLPDPIRFWRVLAWEAGRVNFISDELGKKISLHLYEIIEDSYKVQRKMFSSEIAAPPLIETLYSHIVYSSFAVVRLM